MLSVLIWNNGYFRRVFDRLFQNQNNEVNSKYTLLVYGYFSDYENISLTDKIGKMQKYLSLSKYIIRNASFYSKLWGRHIVHYSLWTPYMYIQGWIRARFRLILNSDGNFLKRHTFLLQSPRPTLYKLWTKTAAVKTRSTKPSEPPPHPAAMRLTAFVFFLSFSRPVRACIGFSENETGNFYTLRRKV